MANLEQQDRHWMQRALDLAKQGEGCVEPNPMVGCVIVRDDQLLGEGYHQKFGGPHAEREAIADAARRGSSDLQGATAYVTLEPCCHHGKTPPCTEAILAAGIRRVCCALLDPFPQVSGKGCELLRVSGVRVDVGMLATEAEELVAPYLKRQRQKLPWIVGKWAMSLDGKIATRTGNSRWISGPSSRQRAHALRGRMDAILVGSGTALADDPLLTVRPPGPRTPLRVVLDSSLAISPDSQLANTARISPVLIWTSNAASPSKVQSFEALGCRVHVSSEATYEARTQALLEHLANHYSATNILVEGGAKLLGTFFDHKWVDECHIFIAPKILGGSAAPSPISGLGTDSLSDGPEVHVRSVERLESDLYVQSRLRWQL